jgi:hypothetical protein
MSEVVANQTMPKVQPLPNTSPHDPSSTPSLANCMAILQVALLPAATDFMLYSARYASKQRMTEFRSQI